MSAIASINFKKSNVIQTRHNDRTLAPSYLISDSGCECNRSHEIAIKLKKQIIENAKEAYKTSCKARNKKFQAKSYEWSAVCNIKPDTTMQDLERLAEHFEQKYGFQCYQIAIHRDEGHLDDDGNKIINHHAHLEFITLDKNTGKNMYRRELISPKILRQIQTEVAEILGMERGQDKRISKRERIEPRRYAQMKEAERKEQAKLKAEHKQELESKEAELKFKDTKLEQEKLSKKQLAELIEAERKAMLQENKELKEANQQAIYITDDYKRLRAIKEQQDIAIQELNEQIQRIKDEAKEAARQKNRQILVTGNHIGKDTGTDDGRGGDGTHAAEHFAEGNADGRGDGFGHQRDQDGPVKPQQQTACQNHRQAADRTGGNTGGNRSHILLQDPELLIHGNGQGDGCRGHEPGNGSSTGFVIANIHTGDQHKHDHQNSTDEGGVTQRILPLCLAQLAHPEGSQSQDQRENGDGEEISHVLSPPFPEQPGQRSR